MGCNKGVANNTMVHSSDDSDVEQDGAASTNSKESEQLTDDSFLKKNVSNSTEQSKVSLDMAVDCEPNSTATETRMENIVTCAFDDTSTELGEGASANTRGSEQLTNESTLNMNESRNSAFISSESSGDVMNMAVHHESISTAREDGIEDIPTEDLIELLFENCRANSDVYLIEDIPTEDLIELPFENRGANSDVYLHNGGEYEHQSENQYESLDIDMEIINEFQRTDENMDIDDST